MKHPVNFNDTETAFAYKSNKDLTTARLIFSLWNRPWLSHWSNQMMLLGLKLHLPIKWIIKQTAYKQFIGGESIQKCEKNVLSLSKFKVGSILDYSVEGGNEEIDFDKTEAEILRTIEFGNSHHSIPFSVFKITGLARTSLLIKKQSKENLTSKEEEEFLRVKNRVHRICEAASKGNVRIFIDAEESWFQDTIDDLAMEMMQKFNATRPVVYNTYQLYRHDRLSYLESNIELAKKKNFIIGAKLVRGAYMEKERRRAEEYGYPSPIHKEKADVDSDYNASLELCCKNIKHIAFCAGTHNEISCSLLTELMANYGLKDNDPHVYFAQLYGMSDHLTFNLAKAGYLAGKYLPYGPVRRVMPYLVRRAEENTGIAGQMTRELVLILKELKRRQEESASL